MNQSNTQLPAEVVKQIDKDAEHYANVEIGSKDKIIVPAVINQWEQTNADFRAGATEYVTKLHEARQLIEKMNERCKGLYHEELTNEIKKFLYGK